MKKKEVIATIASVTAVIYFLIHKNYALSTFFLILLVGNALLHELQEIKDILEYKE